LTDAAKTTVRLETGLSAGDFSSAASYIYDENDISASVASGSFQTDGMIVVPCSMKTLSAIAAGYAANLLTRAADVTLKEGRKLVLVPRETPLGKVHLRNMTAAADLGAAIVPPMLTFYNAPESLDDQITHVIGKCLALFGLKVPGFKEWKGEGGK
jgi:4-hydroxy-3-polyprenylbenzoate decarboxylase